MTRKKKLMLNMFLGVIKQATVVVCGFLLPKYIMSYYGSGVNGLLTSISHFLGFISLLEMGIGPVIQSNLYQPLVKKDTVTISKVIISSERFFRKIAIVFLAYIAVLFFIYPIYINTSFDFWFTVSLLLIIAISTFAEYFFGMTYQILLNADQKAYIQLSLQIAALALNTIISVILIRNGFSIHVVKLVSATIFVLRPIGQLLYVKRHYSLDKSIKLTEEPIKQKWNGFSQHLASVVRGNIDVVLLTLFSTMENLSVYSVYYLVTNGVYQIIYMGATGIESFFGNILANDEKDTLTKSFEMVELLFHAVISFLFSITIVTAIPFVRIYTKNITDADYVNHPIFSFMLCCAFASQALKIPYFRVIKAAGRFKETQNGAYISMGLNVIVSISLIFKFGLAGIAFGTLVSMFFHTCYFANYLRNHIIYRSIKHFILYVVADCSVILGIYVATRKMEMSNLSYGSWIVLAIKVSLVALSICLVVYSIIGHKQIKYLFECFRTRLNRRT